MLKWIWLALVVLGRWSNPLADLLPSFRLPPVVAGIGEPGRDTGPPTSAGITDPGYSNNVSAAEPRGWGRIFP
jgi:hypothetical protein